MLEELASKVWSGETQRVIDALASDERMDEIWHDVREWTDVQKSHFTESAFLFATIDILDDLLTPPEKRVTLSGPSYQLSIAAEHFANAIKEHPLLAKDFWPESTQSLVSNLRTFSRRLSTLTVFQAVDRLFSSDIAGEQPR